MKILVTGSNGFIGKHVCEKLKKTHELMGIGTSTTSLVSNIEYYQCKIQSETFVDTLSKKIKKCEIIIHLAALIDKNDLNSNLIDVNCRGALNIVKLAKKIGVKKIINISGMTVIGKPISLPITESHSTDPKTLYHASKLMAEHIINLSSKYNIKAINLRVPSPVGPGMNQGTILPTILNNCLSNKSIVIYGEGKRRQNYIDVRDIVRAINSAVNIDSEGTFNIAAKTISNLDLAKLCIKITNSSSKIVFNQQIDPEENYSWETSTSKAKETFSFEPKFSLTDTINALLSFKA